MLAPLRQEMILTRVRDRGAVRVTDLVSELDVSDMTIRRDITELARQGLVRRVHGGAVATGRPTSHEPGFRAKQDLAAAQKEAVARTVLSQLRPGQSVALSAGTTTHRVAQLIARTPELRPLTVVTNSLQAADALHCPDDRDLDVVLVGGIRTPSDALVGPVATATLARLRVDVLVLGVHGFDAEAGLTTPNLLEAETDTALVASAHRLVVAADHTKWGEIGLARIAPLDAVDVFITDEALPTHAADLVRDAVGELVLARPGDAL